MGQENGGHGISGHVDTKAVVDSIDDQNNNWVAATFKVAAKWTPYLFLKGFVSVNGASLTIAKLDKEAGLFSVAMIPETLKQTTFDTKFQGTEVNIEIDRQTQIIVDTIRNSVREIMLAK